MRRFLLLPFSLLILFSNLRAAEAPPSCPYCGRSVVKGPVGPPVAVMVDNHPGARPQSGLNQACLVFEAPVEGGITRFMAVYGHGQEVPKIGPVRSIRPYFVRLAKSLGAVLAHCGGSYRGLRHRVGTGPSSFRRYPWGLSSILARSEGSLPA